MQPQPFDTYAATYDDHFTRSMIGSAQRAQVRKLLNRFLTTGMKNILEVNCGTGEDAIWLACKGYAVTATDSSEGMLRTAENKTQNSSVQLAQVASQNIATLQPQTFDLVFSNFGGLNCLDPEELQQFCTGCDQLQKKDGLVALVIMGTHCRWERWYYRLKKEPATAQRRKNGNGVPTRINDVDFRTWYYAPSEIAQLFAESYKTLLVRPIGLFVPPSYLEGFFKKYPFLLRVLVVLDRLFARFAFQADKADHFFILLQKTRS